MVEGHQCHRVAHHHRNVLLGKKFQASSPNGRFVAGAKAIDGQKLQRIEVIGKNLFYFFGPTAVLHFHFGMSGAFKTFNLPGEEPKPTTRLRLVNEEEDIVAHLSAMTVNIGAADLYEEKLKALGPDPLREDADKERFWQKVSQSKKPIGLMLMDQSCLGGIGNIYRAEILFQSRLHPEQPANTVPREKFEELWSWCVLDLQRGFKTGSILTVSPADAKRLGAPWTRRYVYNHQSCGECGGPIKTWDMANRTVYACEVCQQLVQGSVLAENRSKALSAAAPSVVFVSHCAPEGPETASPQKLRLTELKQRLQELGLPTDGKKADLVKRLLASNTASLDTKPSKAAADLESTLVDVKEEEVTGTKPSEPVTLTVTELRAMLKAEGFPTTGRKAELLERLEGRAANGGGHGPREGIINPGTRGLGEMATAEEAVREKAEAGENRAVEHVALVDGRAGVAVAGKGRGKRKSPQECAIATVFHKRKPRAASSKSHSA